MQHVKSDEPPMPEAIFWGLGAILGASLGALMERPRVAALRILAGGLASSISMAVLIPHPDSAIKGLVMVFVIVAGPCIGHLTASPRNAEGPIS
jgi:hypothetical protein